MDVDPRYSALIKLYIIKAWLIMNPTFRCAQKFCCAVHYPHSYPKFSIQLMKLSVTNSASTSTKPITNSGIFRLRYKLKGERKRHIRSPDQPLYQRCYMS